MADKSKTKLPNLKICIDNTDSDDSSSSESSEDDKLSLDDDEEIDEPQELAVEEKGEDEETGLHVSSDTKTDVEFNVRLGPTSKKRSEIRPFLKTYENKAGSFVTGIDLTNEEELKKKEERARRFGIEMSQENEANISDLYKSLGIREEDLSRKDERGIRLEAIHFRGVDDMNTKDIFAYFKEFGPAGVEWIDDSSCNVVWLDKVTAARAMMKLSRSYDVLMQQLQGKEMEKKGAEGSDPMETNENKDKNDKREENKSETHKVGDEDKKKRDARSLRDGEEPMEEGSDDDDSLDLIEDSRTVIKDKSSKEERESKSADEEAKSDREEGEITDDSEDDEDQQSDQEQKENRGEGKSQRRKKKIPWPPGKWRLGITTSKARYLFMRFATKADTKLPGAERRSRYYQKYGNPNYGGIKGLISTSRKRKYNATRTHDDVEEAREAVEKAQRKIVSYAGVDMFTDVINKDDDVRNVEHADSAWGVGPNKPVSDQPKFIFEKSPEEEKPRFILEQSELGPKQMKDASEDSDESEVDEEELERLLGPPIKKRTMRMYADDVEEEIKKKKTLQQGDLTITTDTKRGSSPVRIKDARELIKGLQVKPKETDIKSRLQLRTRVSPLVWDDENFRSSDESDRDDDDGDDHTSSPDTRHVKSRVSRERSPDSRLYRTIKNKGTDLRSKLDTRKKTGSSKFQNMKIEVFD